MSRYNLFLRLAISLSGLLLLSLFRFQVVMQPFNYVIIGLGSGMVLIAIFFPRSNNDLIEDISKLDHHDRSLVRRYSLECEVKLFDRLISEIRSAKDPKQRRRLIGKLRPTLRSICSFSKNWEGGLRLRAYVLVKILERFIDSPNETHDILSLLITVMIKECPMPRLLPEVYRIVK